MRIIDELSPIQVRILGALLEKEQATPDYYPLTVNALLAACNQKSNREPVMAITEEELWDQLEALRAEVLVWRSDGARVPRWSQSISRRLELDPEEKAVLTVLMLRDPQTVGELKVRTQRLHAFDDLAEVHAVLGRLSTEERDLVAELPRRPGQKESRWMQLLGGSVEDAGESRVGSEAMPGSPRLTLATGSKTEASTAGPSLANRVTCLEQHVGELQSAVERLLEKLDS